MEDRRTSFVVTLRALNSQFASWVQGQQAEHGAEMWTDGVEDYLTYARALLDEFKDVLDETGKPADKAAPPASGPTAPAPFAFSATAGAFGLGTTPAAGTALAPSFATTPASAPAFGAGSAPAFGAGAAPLFGGGAAASAPAFGGFTFGGAPAGGLFGASGATPGGGGEAGGEEDDEHEEAEPEEPSVALEPSDADILAKHRVKLLSTGPDKKWADRGMGTLTLRRPKAADGGGPRSPYFVFTTDSGRVLVNSPLLKGVHPMVQGKAANNVLVMLANVAEAEAGGGTPERRPYIFRCLGAEEATQLKEEISEHV